MQYSLSCIHLNLVALKMRYVSYNMTSMRSIWMMTLTHSLSLTERLKSVDTADSNNVNTRAALISVSIRTTTCFYLSVASREGIPSTWNILVWCLTYWHNKYIETGTDLNLVQWLTTEHWTYEGSNPPANEKGNRLEMQSFLKSNRELESFRDEEKNEKY